MYVEQYTVRQEEILALNNDHWRRFRIQWADFRNANRGKNTPAVFGHQLYHLPEDDRKPEYHEIDIEAMKRRFGSKIKKHGK
jgi:hypothetical protein